MRESRPDISDLRTLAVSSNSRMEAQRTTGCRQPDRKSTRLNSSHSSISYAVFCLKKKKRQLIGDTDRQPGLAHPARTDQGEEPDVLLKEGTDVGDLPLPADEDRQWGQQGQTEPFP